MSLELKLKSFCLGFILFLSASTVLADVGEDISLEGGDTTVDSVGVDSYDFPLANLSDSRDLQDHDLGGDGFRRNFARSAIKGKVRIGPKFNNVSCVSCHPNNGRGEPKFERSGSQSVVKLSAVSGKPLVAGGPIPVKGIGLQLHDHSIRGARPDGKVSVEWESLSGSYPDGYLYELRKPKVIIGNANIPGGTMLSLRRPPPVFGVGLIDAVSSDTIISMSDPADDNNDGISGRVNWVWDVVKRKLEVGKFGWKAATPTVNQQIANAYSNDMGVTNPLVKLGDRITDIDLRILNRTIFYTQTLAVPKARNQDSPLIQSGKSAFRSFNCNACHVMTLTTGGHVVSALSHQVVHPFSDLLLHDMGPELADNRPEFLASGTEWRTAPLWGIGLAQTVLNTGAENYLHDGRARSLEEAILWHGGEAQAAKEGFVAAAKSDRDALIEFLRSL